MLSDVHPERGTHPHLHWNNVPHTGKGSRGKRALELENPQIADSDSDAHARTHARSRTHIEVHTQCNSAWNDTDYFRVLESTYLSSTVLRPSLAAVSSSSQSSHIDLTIEATTTADARRLK